MLQPNRHKDSKSYRYGFQGQEKDDEIKGEGNSVNYKYRMHDPRIGRFFTVDPLTKQYPHYTPYSFSGNKVIAYGELEGLEEIIKTTKFAYWSRSVFDVINKSEMLKGYYDAISLESKKDKQIIYFTTYSGQKALGNRGPNNGFTMKLNSLITRTNKLNKEKGYNRTKNNYYNINMSLFKENGIKFEELNKHVQDGKDVFLLAINTDKIGEADLDQKLITIIHEINANDHLKDLVNGVEPKNGHDGHILYFDLNNHPSGLTQEQIENDYSPHPEDVHEDSQAGKDAKEIKNTIQWMQIEAISKAILESGGRSGNGTKTNSKNN